MSTLVIWEHDRALARETVVAAAELGQPVSVAAFGKAPAEIPAAVERVYVLEHALLVHYTADGYAAALEQLIAKVTPSVVLFPHTYQVRDYAPKLATRLGKPLVSDAIKIRADSEGVVCTRQLFQGKISADYRTPGAGPHFVSIQAGAYRGDGAAVAPGGVETFSPALDASSIRAKPEEPFRESARAVDLTAADVIVSVGRGIKEKDNIAIIEQLASAMGAEIAASRPICDNGWLPMERQVGSSGQTVAPKLYLAVGISGAIQHLVGMKGARTVIAINRDPDAPIFEIADYGVVGDLFEVVPALTEEVKKLR